MRKVFIDGGANKGQSIDLFINHHPEASEYEIHSFECTTSGVVQEYLEEAAERARKAGCTVKLYDKALWSKNEEGVAFYDSYDESSSLLKRDAPKVNLAQIQTIQLSEFILKNFSANDCIVLKLDIEGAEYEVFKDLIDTGAIKHINKIYGELHGPKCGTSLEEDLVLIEKLETFGHKIYYWDASNDSGIGDKFYTEEALRTFHNKERFRKEDK